MNDGTIIYDNISRYLSNFGEPALWACPIQQGVPILFNLLFIGLLWFGLNAMIGVLRSNSLGLLMSLGDEEKIKASREGIRNGIIGLIMVLTSLFFFVMFVRGFLGVQFQIFDGQGDFNGFFVIRNAEGESIDQCQEKIDMFSETTTTESEETRVPATVVPDKKDAAKPTDSEEKQQASNDALLLPNSVESNDLPIRLTEPADVQS